MCLPREAGGKDDKQAEVVIRLSDRTSRSWKIFDESSDSTETIECSGLFLLHDVPRTAHDLTERKTLSWQ
jgi:hypothetical protein